jgi:hypothetical protein
LLITSPTDWESRHLGGGIDWESRHLGGGIDWESRHLGGGILVFHFSVLHPRWLDAFGGEQPPPRADGGQFQAVDN